MEQVKINSDNKEIMVYMGSYVRDRSEGKYNDYVTYSENPRVSYKSYMNLKTDKVCNIEKDECDEFESNNIIIKMPISSCSFDSYISNYMYLKNWYLRQLESKAEEDITKELNRVSKLKYIRLYLECHNYREKQLDKKGNVYNYCLAKEK